MTIGRCAPARLGQRGQTAPDRWRDVVELHVDCGDVVGDGHELQLSREDVATYCGSK
jgi:hypothetical protein